MEVYFSMTEKDVIAMGKNAGGLAGAIEAMPAVKLKLADGTEYGQEGRVTKMSGVIDAATGSVQIMVALVPSSSRRAIPMPSSFRRAVSLRCRIRSLSISSTKTIR